MHEPDSGVTRARLLRAGGGGAAVVLLGSAAIGSVPPPAASAPSAAQDERTLAYLLELEDLQAAFYAQALERANLAGELREFAEVVGGHEREHADYLRKALGPKAARPKAYDFGEAVSTSDRFLATAIDLEETGLGAYTGAAPNLRPATLRDASRIVSVEARHTAWARDLSGENPAPRATDEPSTEAEVRAAIERTAFVKGG
jgi:rubrerythrin